MKDTLMLFLLFIIILLLLSFTGGKVCAQKVNRDSLRRIAFSRDSIFQDSLADIDRTINMAKSNGRRLRLSPTQRQQFKASNKNANSDLFKPTRATVSDTTFLYDSLYVKTYRLAAYKKALGDAIIIPRSYWGSLGLGGNTPGYVAFSINVNEEVPQKLLITESLLAESNALFGGTTLVSCSVLAGEIFKQRFSMFTVSAGLGYVNKTVSGGLFSNVPATNQSTIGFPILIQGYLVALQTVGLGINAYVNLNSLQTTAGITLSLALGRLATHERKNMVDK